MADTKFSAFTSGGQNQAGDILVGLRGGANYQFTAPTGGLQAWNNIPGTTQAAAVNNGYIIGNAGQTTVTLPETAALGDQVSIRGLGAAGWILAANTGQTLKVDGQTTSSGGTLTSAGQYDSIDVCCVVANTTWITSASVSSGFTYA